MSLACTFCPLFVASDPGWSKLHWCCCAQASHCASFASTADLCVPASGCALGYGAQGLHDEHESHKYQHTTFIAVHADTPSSLLAQLLGNLHQHDTSATLASNFKGMQCAVASTSSVGKQEAKSVGAHVCDALQGETECEPGVVVS